MHGNGAHQLVSSHLYEWRRFLANGHFPAWNAAHYIFPPRPWPWEGVRYAWCYVRPQCACAESRIAVADCAPLLTVGLGLCDWKGGSRLLVLVLGLGLMLNCKESSLLMRVGLERLRWLTTTRFWLPVRVLSSKGLRASRCTDNSWSRTSHNPEHEHEHEHEHE